MKVVATIQARSTSARLPRKVLAPIAGRPLIYHVLDRASAIVGIDDLVVTIPHGDVDLLDTLQTYGARVCFGPEHDVLRRYLLAAEYTEADVIVRVTADCPLLDPAAATEVLAYVRGGCDYAWNDTLTSGWPDGMDIEAFTFAALVDADREALRSGRDREHVTPVIRRRARRTGYVSLRPESLLGKVSVDTAADLERVRRIVAHLSPGDYSHAATEAAFLTALRPSTNSPQHVHVGVNR
jgi:spore coat polysaccharide biosynthesis protein SpsF (cytidylyltransferase family)